MKSATYPIKIKKTPRPKQARTLYWPGCAVCQYMKKYPEFKKRCMESTYFDRDGEESLAEVLVAAGNPFALQSMYSHMQRHQTKDMIAAQAKVLEGTITDPGASAVAMVELPVGSNGAHEVGLDAFIAKGRLLLANEQMKVTAKDFLQAIKIKADIEKSTKDRKLDAMKAFFGGGGKSESETEGAKSAPAKS